MADIYLYVPCNGTRYYTANDVEESNYTIYGDTELDSYQDGNRIYTEFNNRALFIENDSASGIDGSYTLEWWQKDAGSTDSNNLLTISNREDWNKLQLHNYYTDKLHLSFEESPYGLLQLSANISNFNNNTWTHFAYVFDYDNKKSYYFKNGVYQDTQDTLEDLEQRDALYFACIGAKGTEGSHYAEEFFGGKISDIVFYKGVKYEENETFTPPEQSPDTTDLIAYGTPSYEPPLEAKYYVSKQGKGKTNAVKRIVRTYYKYVYEQEETTFNPFGTITATSGWTDYMNCFDGDSSTYARCGTATDYIDVVLERPIKINRFDILGNWVASTARSMGLRIYDVTDDIETLIAETNDPTKSVTNYTCTASFEEIETNHLRFRLKTTNIEGNPPTTSYPTRTKEITVTGYKQVPIESTAQDYDFYKEELKYYMIGENIITQKRLNINTSISDVTIMINGEQKTSILLDAGSNYTWSATKQGYKTASGSGTIINDTTIDIDALIVNISPTPDTLEINDENNINGILFQKGTDLQYTIYATKTGYNDLNLNGTITETTTINESMEPISYPSFSATYNNGLTGGETNALVFAATISDNEAGNYTFTIKGGGNGSSGSTSSIYGSTRYYGYGRGGVATGKILLKAGATIAFYRIGALVPPAKKTSEVGGTRRPGGQGIAIYINNIIKLVAAGGGQGSITFTENTSGTSYGANLYNAGGGGYNGGSSDSSGNGLSYDGTPGNNSTQTSGTPFGGNGGVSNTSTTYGSSGKGGSGYVATDFRQGQETSAYKVISLSCTGGSNWGATNTGNGNGASISFQHE